MTVETSGLGRQREMSETPLVVLDKIHLEFSSQF